MKKYLTLLIAMFALAGTLAQAQIVKKEGAFFFYNLCLC
jgi:hypothetical protein